MFKSTFSKYVGCLKTRWCCGGLKARPLKSFYHFSKISFAISSILLQTISFPYIIPKLFLMLKYIYLPRYLHKLIHSLDLRNLCMMKWSRETLKNFHIFWNKLDTKNLHGQIQKIREVKDTPNIYEECIQKNGSK